MHLWWLLPAQASYQWHPARPNYELDPQAETKTMTFMLELSWKKRLILPLRFLKQEAHHTVGLGETPLHLILIQKRC